MAVRSGKQYVEGLRDDRQVWVGGKRVTDVTDYSVFRGSVTGMAGYFDWQNDNADVCVIDNTGLGNAVGISHLIPRSQQDLIRRHAGLERIARYSAGLLGRTPDYVNVTFAGFAGQPDVWARNANQAGWENLIAYQREVADRDLALTHTIIHPLVDGRVAPYAVPNRDVALHKVGETEHGIVVRGARILATLGPFADEIAVYPGQPIPKDANDVALVFSIPMDTPGLKILCRDHYGVDASGFDRPISSRFDEQDAFVVFDDVEVPHHRVFLDGDVDIYNRAMSRGWSGNVMQQTFVRATVKLEFAYELCSRMARALGTDARPDVAAMLGEIWSYAELTRAAVRAAEADAYDFGAGTWFCDERPYRALRPMMPGWMTRVNEIIKQIGSHNLLATPVESDFADPELGPLIEQYLGGVGGISPEERARLFRTAWDMVGSALGGRIELYERYYLASAGRTYGLAHLAAQSEREWDYVPRFWEIADHYAVD